MTTPRPRDASERRTAPAGVAPLAAPLLMFAEDHDRVRSICALIERIVDRDVDGLRAINDVVGFVRTELPVLIADEDEDLFPLMQRRCLPEDEIGRLRARLEAEHDKATYLLPDALEILGRLGRGAEVSEPQKHLLRDFARHLHRHLIYETAILLPLARARLTDDDLARLRARMLKRREADRPPGGGDAG